jgi:Putative zinc-finger
MKDCEDVRTLMAEALLGELAPGDKARLESHLAVCPSCAEEYEGLRETLRLMDKRERPDPGREFWDGYWGRLRERLERESPAERPAVSWWKRLAGPARALPRWTYQTAAAVALVGAGILIGRLLLSPPGPSTVHPGGIPGSALIPASTGDPAARAREYLDRSKLVILALVNYNPATEDAYALDLPLQKKLSRELVTEAAGLKTDLKAPRDRRLRELVSDLETILIQIANLESENNLEAVEFVRQGVATRGVLLKINLSEMDGKAKNGGNPKSLGRPGTDKSSA